MALRYDVDCILVTWKNDIENMEKHSITHLQPAHNCTKMYGILNIVFPLFPLLSLRNVLGGGNPIDGLVLEFCEVASIQYKTFLYKNIRVILDGCAPAFLQA